MLGFAFAMAAFKFMQGIATLRISTRMGSSIQSALWDRIMDLPVNFFRMFSAGDLADRADGVEEIQELISGAGVSAILGSISGMFYVCQMFGYDLTLALVAVGLTITFVTVNMTCNYLQLRFQRQEMTIRGSITGLVLNLLTGVSKLRICGAEQHAFRVWAEQFATQRKISFTVGKIQNAAETFGTFFPILVESPDLLRDDLGAVQGRPPGPDADDRRFHRVHVRVRALHVGDAVARRCLAQPAAHRAGLRALQADPRLQAGSRSHEGVPRPADGRHRDLPLSSSATPPTAR